MVSLGWYREFFRMRRALPPAPQASIVSQGVVVTLPVEGADARVTPSSHVVVRCSATSWRVDTPAQFVPGPDRFEATLVVDPGQYQVCAIARAPTTIARAVSPLNPHGSMASGLTARRGFSLLQARRCLTAVATVSRACRLPWSPFLTPRLSAACCSEQSA